MNVYKVSDTPRMDKARYRAFHNSEGEATCCFPGELLGEGMRLERELAAMTAAKDKLDRHYEHIILLIKELEEVK